MATHTVAMGAVHVLGNIVRAWRSGDVPGLYAALEAAVTSLVEHFVNSLQAVSAYFNAKIMI